MNKQGSRIEHAALTVNHTIFHGMPATVAVAVALVTPKRPTASCTTNSFRAWCSKSLCAGEPHATKESKMSTIALPRVATGSDDLHEMALKLTNTTVRKWQPVAPFRGGLCGVCGCTEQATMSQPHNTDHLSHKGQAFAGFSGLTM